MPFLRPPSRITVLLICPVALLLLAVGVIFHRGLSSAGVRFAAIGTLETGYETSRRLTDAAIAVVSERGETVALLGAADVRKSPSGARLPEARKRTDALMAVLLSRDDPEMGALAERYAALKEARASADTALEAPLPQRSAFMTRDEWTHSTDALLREAERIMKRIAFIPGDETGKFASFALLRLRILQFRIAIENTSARVLRLLLRSAADRAEEIHAVHRLRGGESSVWENARTLAPFAGSVSLDRHVSSADRYYAEMVSPALDAILRSPDHGVPPETYRETIAPLLRLTETCLLELDDAMRRSLEALRASIRAGIAREKGLFAGMFLFALSLSLLFIYRVARPLDLIRGIVTDLQAGKLDAPFPKTRHDDEIGTLAETLERFRQTLQERARMEQKLLRLATTDELTALANRRRFLEAGGNETERSRRDGSPVSLLMLDLDGFKDVNDRYGHPTGDAALRLFADTCARALRRSDLFGRLGGEEFAILLPDTTSEDAAILAERVRADVEGTVFPSEEGNFSITVSIGVASMSGPGDSLNDLLRRADRALYESKRAGRNRATVA